MQSVWRPKLGQALRHLQLRRYVVRLTLKNPNNNIFDTANAIINKISSQDAVDFSSAASTEIGFIRAKRRGIWRDVAPWIRPTGINVAPVAWPSASTLPWTRTVSCSFFFAANYKLPQCMWVRKGTLRSPFRRKVCQIKLNNERGKQPFCVLNTFGYHAFKCRGQVLWILTLLSGDYNRAIAEEFTPSSLLACDTFTKIAISVCF